MQWVFIDHKIVRFIILIIIQLLRHGNNYQNHNLI